MKKKAQKQQGEGAFWKPLGYSLMIVVLVLAIVQITRSAVITQKVADTNLQLVSEFENVRNGVAQFGDDLNEIRDYLLLPKHDYDFFRKPEKPLPQEGDTEKSDEMTQGVFHFVQHVGQSYLSDKQKAENEKAIRDLHRDYTFRNALKPIGLAPARYLENTELYIAFKFYVGRDPLIQLIFNKTDGSFMMQSIQGKETLDIPAESSLGETALQFLKDNKELIESTGKAIHEQQAALRTFWDEEDVRTVLSGHQLQVTLNPVETEDGFEYTVQNADSEPLLTLILKRQDAQWQFGGVDYPDIPTFKPLLLENLQKLDGVSKRMKEVADKKERFLGLLKDPAFLGQLTQSHLELQEPREEGARLVADLNSADDQTLLGRLIFEMETGGILYYDARQKTEFNADEIFSLDVKKNG